MPALIIAISFCLIQNQNAFQTVWEMTMACLENTLRSITTGQAYTQSTTDCPTAKPKEEGLRARTCRGSGIYANRKLISCGDMHLPFMAADGLIMIKVVLAIH